MTRAFWIFTGVAGDGLTPETAFRPDLPAGVGGKSVTPGDVMRITGPAGPNAHTHLLVGGIAQPDDNLIGLLGEGHRHYVVFFGGQWRQVTIGAQNHTHDLNLDANGNMKPDFYLVFWAGEDADAALIEAHPGVLVACEATVDETGEAPSYANLDNTPWNAATKTLWNTRALNVLGLQLPDEVDRGNRLVRLFLGALISRQTPNERGYRFSQ